MKYKTDKQTIDKILKASEPLINQTFSVMLRNFSVIKSHYGIKPGILTDDICNHIGLIGSGRKTVYCYISVSHKTTNLMMFAKITGECIIHLACECLGVKYHRLFAEDFNVYADVKELEGYFFLKHPEYKIVNKQTKKAA